MASLIAATTSASTSTDVVVTEPTQIHCYPDDGTDFVGYVEKKNSDGTYTAFKASEIPGQAPTRVSLDQINTSILIAAPGTYRVVKLATTVAIGIDTEA